MYAMAGRRASPLPPVGGGASGDGEANRCAAITSVTTVTSKLDICGASGPLAVCIAAGRATSTCESAMESGTMPVTSVTLVTAAKTLRNSAPIVSGDGRHSGDTGDHAWDDLDHWRFRLGSPGAGRDARLQTALDWVRAAGGTIDTAGERIRAALPAGLADGYALCELKRLAPDLGVIDRVVLPETAAEACTSMPIGTRPADLPDDFGKSGAA